MSFLSIRRNQLNIKCGQKIFRDRNNVRMLLEKGSFEEMKTNFVAGAGRTQIKSLRNMYRIGRTNRYIEVKTRKYCPKKVKYNFYR